MSSVRRHEGKENNLWTTCDLTAVCANSVSEHTEFNAREVLVICSLKDEHKPEVKA